MHSWYAAVACKSLDFHINVPPFELQSTPNKGRPSLDFLHDGPSTVGPTSRLNSGQGKSCCDCKKVYSFR